MEFKNKQQSAFKTEFLQSLQQEKCCHMHFLEEMLLNKLEVAEAMKIQLLVVLFSRVPKRDEIHGIS